MPNKTKPSVSSSSDVWGNQLNQHLEQLMPDNGGGINKFEQFSQRPTNLGVDDRGKTYLYTQTGNIHQWTGTTWKVLNDSVINVKDYGAVGDDTGITPQDSNVDITNASWNIWPSLLTGSDLNPADADYATKIAEVEGYNAWYSLTPPYAKPFTNLDSWDYIGIQLALWQSSPAHTEVYIPAGIYKLTREIRYTNRMRATLRGAGILQSILRYKNISDFSFLYKSNKCLLYMYRIGGTPTFVISPLN